MPRLALTLLLLLASISAFGATTTTVVDIPTRGGTVRILYVHPDNPVANLVVLSGGDGVLGIQDDGTMSTFVASCGPVVRNRQAFVDHGFALALVDQASDGWVGNYLDVVEVIRYVRARDSVPTWAIGGSSSTGPIVYLAGHLPPENPLGMVAFSPGPVNAADAALVTRRAGIIFNGFDISQRAGTLYSQLTSASVKESISVSGGSDQGCGYHLFNGLNAQFVAAVTGFIDRNNAALAAESPTTALAVEFYNATLDHYFLTHIANEIAILDAGVTIRGWVRTGQSFNVYAAAGAQTSPVCRYYIPPAKGDSHFYGRGTAECTATGAANPSFIDEDAQFFHVVLPTLGVCPAGTRNVHRVFSNRLDANHRYMVDSATRDHMVTTGWLAEGDGPDLVVMCAPL